MLDVGGCSLNNDRFRFRFHDLGVTRRLLEARLPRGCLFLLVPAKVKNFGLSKVAHTQGALGNERLAGPLVGFLGTTNRTQSFSVCAEEARAVGEGPVDVQLRDLKLADSSIQLLEVSTCAGGNNGKLNLARSVKVLGFRRADHVQSTVRAAKATLAVSHHRQVHVGPTDAAVRTEFTQGFAVVAGGVGRQANRFADYREAATAAACSKGVLEGQFGLNVDQPASHDQVLGDPPGALLLKGLDLVTRGAVELLARDVLINFRGTFAVRTVGAADVLGVGNPCRTLFPRAAAFVAVTTKGTTFAAAFGPIAEGLTVATVAEGLAVTGRRRTERRSSLSRRGPSKFRGPRSGRSPKGLRSPRSLLKGRRIAVTGGTVVRHAGTVAEGLAVSGRRRRSGGHRVAAGAIKVPRSTLGTVAERLTVAAVIVEGTTLAVTGRTVITVAEGLAVTVVVERTTLTITGGTIITVAKGLAVTVTAKGTTLTVTGRTVIAVTERLRSRS